MICRTRDATLVNRLLERDFANVDFSEALANQLNVCLIEGDSGAAFAWRGPGIYEVHLFYAVRGRQALDLFAEMIAHVRAEHGGRFFWALVPMKDRHVRMFARLTGFLPSGILQTQHGPNELFVSENVECLQLS